MAEFLVIRLRDNAAQSADWIAVDNNGTRRSPPVTGPLAEATRDTGGRQVIVLVPATRVLSTVVDMPVKGGARLRAALPFALEEQLAEDVDELHFASGERRDNGLLPVAVVARAQMQAWLDRLREAGIVPDRLIAENQGLASIPGTLSMLVAENQIMFNDGADSEFVMQDVKPSDVLAVAGVLHEQNDEQGSGGHLLAYCEPGEEQRFANDWTALRHELSSVDIHLLPDGVLPRLAVTVAAGRGINLLQGRFGARTNYRELLAPWRYVAGLLLALALVSFAGKGVDWYRLRGEEAALQDQFAVEYRQIRPDDTRPIVDPLRIVAELRGNRPAPVSTDFFLPSLYELGQALAQNSGVDIEAISYRADTVDIRLTAPDVATLDSIQRTVGRSGRFAASIQSTDQVGDKVSSRIQVRAGGS